jgi:pSer/pThr/pTyr-binding forkhead associated (FHA) protein
MAFIIVADSKSQEIDRRELVGPIIIGRSPEVDLPVRDILLSRKHCLIERLGDAWVIADLGSKNGTLVNGDLINRHVLHDCDVIRIGRTRIAFREGKFVPAPPNVSRAKQRPADPLEAMAGTLSGFRFSEEEEEALDQRVLETFPRPKPRPADPRAYQSDKVQAMIADIASSAWDSVLMEEDRKTNTTTLPKPMVSIVIPRPAAVPAMAQVTTKPSRPPKVWFDPKRVLMMLYIGMSLMITAASVWVISWNW